MICTGSYSCGPRIQTTFFLYYAVLHSQQVFISSALCAYCTMFSLALVDTAASGGEKDFPFLCFFSFFVFFFFFICLTTQVKVEGKSQDNMLRSHHLKCSGKWLRSRWLHEPALSTQSDWLPKRIKLKSNLKFENQDVFLSTIKM